MSGVVIGLLGFVILLVLIVCRVHIGIAMFLSGAGIFLILTGWEPSALLFTMNNMVFARFSNYDLAVIPLFILMGQFATQGGLSESLFKAAGALIGHFKGGLAMASTAACAAFGAISGSSIATAATMSQVALPELEKQGYSGRLATSTLAASGTLGILIPPSVPLVIYAVITRESMGKLFVAAVIPGVIAAIGYLCVIRFLALREFKDKPSQKRLPLKQIVRLQLNVIPVAFVFLVVIFGIYAGWANPTEAAAIGVFSCGIIAILNKRLGWKEVKKSIYSTAETSALIFLVLLGADMLNTALALSQMPVELANWVQAHHFSPLIVLLCILLIYLVLGCVMDALSMILLTVPIFYPIIMGLDFFGLSQPDKSVWFGILALMVIEIGMITPPVGMNLYIVNKISGTTPLSETIKGIVWFLYSDILRVALLVFFPSLSLWLVHALS